MYNGDDCNGLFIIFDLCTLLLLLLFGIGVYDDDPMYIIIYIALYIKPNII